MAALTPKATAKPATRPTYASLRMAMYIAGKSARRVGNERPAEKSRRRRREPGAHQPVVQARSFSGLRIAQMCLIRSPATSNANTVTVTPSC